MTRDELIYVFPYLISLLITSGVFLYAWKHYYVRGAAAYTWFVAGQALTILGFIIELISPSLQIKLQWDFFQWITDTLVIALFMVFATEFTETKFRHPRLNWFFLLLIPFVFLIVIFTDSVHHLIYPNPHLIAGYPFAQLKYDFTFVVYLYALIYLYGYTLFGLGILFKRAFQPHNLLRQQFIIVAIGFLIPVLFSILSLFDISIGGQRDNAPLTLAAGNIIIAWGLFRYRLFEIVPIAREKIIENMTDAVIVLDAANRVVDINSAALINLNEKFSDVMGRAASEAIAHWPDVVEMLEISKEQSREITVKTSNDSLFYDISISPIVVDKRRNLIGHIVVARDITRQKTLEVSYRILSEELEKRVQERTNELAEAYDTTLEGWAKALELRDKETEGHSRRVTETTVKVAQAMGLNEQQLVHIRRGSILHDIGKIGISDDILRKPDSLTEQERQAVMEHPKIAYQLLAHIPHLKDSLEIPYCHHEKWDGTGYPQRLKGTEIPIAARIFAVADVWDALSSDRPYREAWSREKVVQYLMDESGRHFDPKIVEIFVELLNRGEI
ncbi:MAG: HD domain-containing protein [Anaerolineales bacterium]|nr:HD domain-containing protein [Anaerolineales bacterium]